MRVHSSVQVGVRYDQFHGIAGAFLDAHADDIGHRSTADIDVLLAEC